MNNTETVALSGDDTLIINDRLLADFGDGTVVEIDFPNAIATLKVGKNGNSIYSFNAQGAQCEVKVRVIRGSSDDKYFNNLIIQQSANFAQKVLDTGEFIKQIGNGKGIVTNDTYILSGGILEKNIAAKSNVEGDTDQGVAHYVWKFSKGTRILT